VLTSWSLGGYLALRARRTLEGRLASSVERRLQQES
jgi:hypothetical protein